MPTKQDLNDLVGKCDWNWTALNGVQGWTVTGRGAYASASIFLPAVGYGLGTSLYSSGSYGYYWSSVPFSDLNYAYDFYFSSGNLSTSGIYRRDGYPVRPVQGFTE